MTRLSCTHIYLIILSITVFVSCSSPSENDRSNNHSKNQKGEYIYRKHDESFFTIAPPVYIQPKTYPWTQNSQNTLPKITKEHFRCKGNTLNPPLKQNNSSDLLYDCGGLQKHGLPLRNGKEFIYPILIEILNYIQDTTQKRIVITSGHRCPEHNSYVDPSPPNQYSKHTIGAEVDFYVEGMEGDPQKIVEIIQQYYKNNTQYAEKKDYTTFTRYEKGDSNVAIQPWFNKELFIKIFSRNEGRNFDNRHAYPYISIQVRHDRDLNEKVNYSWERATKNYHRK